MEPTVRDARAAYFATAGFSDATYGEPWVRIPIGPLAVYLPSTRGRARALPLHDLHHVATGYGTDLIGEAEIAAWELAAGCHHHHAARIYNAMALAVGVVVAPRRTRRAWQRGRTCQTLYRGEFSPGLLELPLATLRRQLGLA